MPNPIDDARQLISSRLAELDTEAKQLERALAGLGEGSGQGGRRRGRPAKAVGAETAPPSKPRRRATRKGRRVPRGQRRQELLAAIKASPGAKTSELAESIGIKPNQVHALIAKARAEKLIVKSGNGYALKI